MAFVIEVETCLYSAPSSNWASVKVARLKNKVIGAERTYPKLSPMVLW